MYHDSSNCTSSRWAACQICRTIFTNSLGTEKKFYLLFWNLEGTCNMFSVCHKETQIPVCYRKYIILRKVWAMLKSMSFQLHLPDNHVSSNVTKCLHSSHHSNITPAMYSSVATMTSVATHITWQCYSFYLVIRV